MSVRVVEANAKRAAASAAGAAAFAPRPGGAPLDRATRRFMESGFRHDFSRVRLHTDATAAHSADALQARAYTVGSNVVFARGAFAPASRAGRTLIAHELAHVVQNETHGGTVPAKVSAPDDVAEREACGAARQVLAGGHARVAAEPAAVMRELKPEEKTGLGVGLGVLGAVGVGLGIAWLAGAFDGESFTDKELQDYLEVLDKKRGPEGDRNSDNKARAVVRRWMASAAGFAVLTIPIRIFLINEMAAGYLSAGDQDCIYELLREAIAIERTTILSAIAIDQLKARFDTDRRKRLQDLLDTQDVESISTNQSPWTVAETKKIVRRQGDDSLIRRVLGLGFKIFRFDKAIDTWQFRVDGHTEEKEAAGVKGNTDHESDPKRILLFDAMSNEFAAVVFAHEAHHALSGPAKTPKDYPEGEIEARAVAERFGYRHGLPPVEPDYRDARGDPNEAAMRRDVMGSKKYSQTDRWISGRHYEGAKESPGWELEPDKAGGK